ncbi:MAG: hypothetical protein VKI83_11200 [Synechococcaceae cyanobacterium]|nr:hypothetical protein [Synechococcaceae cyanobacterium]
MPAERPFHLEALQEWRTLSAGIREPFKTKLAERLIEPRLHSQAWLDHLEHLRASAAQAPLAVEQSENRSRRRVGVATLSSRSSGEIVAERQLLKLVAAGISGC